MRHLKTGFAVIGAATVLVLAANTVAIAANGHGFLLGKGNSASKMTTLTRTTSGTALQVKTKSSSNAPFAVNGSGKVTHLNADLLDGLDSSTLRPRSYAFSRNVTTPVSTTTMTLTVPNGSYIFNFGALLTGTSGNTYCQVIHQHGSVTNFLGTTNAAASTTNNGRSGSGLVTMSTGDALGLNCASASPFQTPAGTPIQIVLTTTDLVSSTSP